MSVSGEDLTVTSSGWNVRPCVHPRASPIAGFNEYLTASSGVLLSTRFPRNTELPGHKSATWKSSGV